MVAFDEEKNREIQNNSSQRLNVSLGELVGMCGLICGSIGAVHAARDYDSKVGLAVLGYSMLVSFGIMRFSSYLRNRNISF